MPDEAAMLALGARLASALERTGAAPVVVFLGGELGAGKTTLVRGVLRAFGAEGPIRSPTFTLLETYRLGRRLIAHVDLYRLGGPDIEALGLRDLLLDDHAMFVEWPERAADRLPLPDVQVFFDFEDQGRRLRVAPVTGRGSALVQQWLR